MCTTSTCSKYFFLPDPPGRRPHRAGLGAGRIIVFFVLLRFLPRPRPALRREVEGGIRPAGGNGDGGGGRVAHQGKSRFEVSKSTWGFLIEKMLQMSCCWHVVRHRREVISLFPGLLPESSASTFVRAVPPLHQVISKQRIIFFHFMSNYLFSDG